MEKEQLEKKIEWLDAERRKAHDALSVLDKRLAALEKSFNKETVSAKTISGHTSKLDELADKFEDLGEQIKTAKSETKAFFQDFEKQKKQQDRTFEQEQKGLRRVLDDFRKEIGQMQALQSGLNQRAEETETLTSKLDLLKESIQDVIAGEQRRNQIAASLEESSKEDAKRLTEMHSEVAALLTRLESAARLTEGMALSQRKLEKRMDEIALADSERQKEHDVALQRLAVAEADRDHRWKEWDKRFSHVEKLAEDVVGRLKEFENTEMALKRAESVFNELVEKINRRVNELSEIQRLGDQRFRQEWSTFQADAQKRWSSFALTQEEHQRETARQREKLGEQISQLDDQLGEIQDTVQHLKEQSERSMQALLEMARESLAEHERFASNSR
jgi:chromosome segregation ATPase